MKHGFASTTDHDVVSLSAFNSADIISDDDLVGLAATQELSNKTLATAILKTPKIADSGVDHYYTFAVADLAADRQVSLPLLTGNDTFVFESHQQTLANKTLTTPTIASFTNAAHTHQDAAGGGKLDHGLAMTALSLADDDHTQYALLAGRSGGQTLYGGTGDGDDLTLHSTSHENKGTIFIMDAVNMNSKAISAVADPSSPQDAATKAYVDSVAQGLDWQESADYNINYVKAGAPSGVAATNGERCWDTTNKHLYLFTGGAWADQGVLTTGDRCLFKDDGDDTSGNSGTYTADDKIREYNGSTIDETTANEGMALWMEDEDSLYVFTTAWVQFGSTINHGTLSGLQGGTSNEYYHLTSAQHTGLTGGGSTTLHTHSHANIGNLSSDDHAQYALLAGRSGGQTLKGGTGASESLTLESTAHATKGTVICIGNLDMGSTYKVVNLLTPTLDYDAATKKYVDDAVSGENLWDRTGTVLSPHTAGDTLGVGDGTVAAPSYSFANDPNSGVYSSAADTVGVSAGGTLRLSVSTTVVTSTLPFVAPVGAVGSPSFTFTGDTTTGLYRAGAGNLALTTAGTQRAVISATALVTTVPVRVPDGTQAAPSLAFSGNTDTGFYHATGTISVSGDNTQVMSWSSSNCYCYKQLGMYDSVAATPSISFQNDSNSGIFGGGTGDVWGLTAGGTARITIDGTGSGLVTIADELKIKIVKQAAEPSLTATDGLVIWQDTDDSNRTYLLYKRGTDDQVSVELA